MNGEKRVHIFVSGIVQGVFFRDHTRRWAEELGLGGWVRNLADGRVEAVAEGPDEALQAFLSRVRRGAPRSRVDNLEIAWEPFRGEFTGFRISRDG